MYNLQVNMRLFYLQLRDIIDFKGVPELQQLSVRKKGTHRWYTTSRIS